MVAKRKRDYCIVTGCRTNNLEISKRRLFFLPSNKDKLKLWLNKLGIQYLSLSEVHMKDYRICNLHFSDNQFQTSEKLKLNRNAIPNNIYVIDGQTSVHQYLSPQDNIAIFQVEASSSYPDTSNINVTPASVQSETPPDPIRSNQILPRKQSLKIRLQQAGRIIRIIERHTIFRNKIFKTTKKKFPIIGVVDNLPESLKNFLLSQLKNFLKTKQRHRLTLKEKSFFLLICQHSPKFYQYLRKILYLPSRVILQKVLSRLRLKPGINIHLLRYLRVVSDSMHVLDRHCIITFNQMKLAKNLNMVVGKNVCNVEGFADLGEDSSGHIANNVLVFMIRGINQRWKQPVAYFFTRNSPNRFVLKNAISNVIRAVHKQTNFKIVASVCDGGSCNVEAIRLLTLASGRDETDFIYNVDANKIFHIFDVPHLLKYMRNYFVGKSVVYEDNKTAKWADLQKVFIDNGTMPCSKSQFFTAARGFREKIFNIKNADHVFSYTCDKCLTVLSVHGIMDGMNTARFVGFMNDLYDSLNSDPNSQNPLSRCLRLCSGHFPFWRFAKPFLQGMTFFDEHGNEVATPWSVHGFICTIRNVQSLWKRLYNIGFGLLRTRFLKQDPVDDFFSSVRELCKSNTHPTSSQFTAAFRTCVLNNTVKSSRSYLLSMMKSQTSSSVPQSFNSVHSTFRTAVDIANRINKLVGSSIAGNLLRRLLQHNCQFCKQFLLTDICSDSHDVIKLKEYDGTRRLKYPSGPFVAAIIESRDKISSQIPRLIHLPDFFSRLTQSTYSIPSAFCPQHGVILQSITVNLLCLVMIKHFTKMVNLKLNNKNMRSKKIIDDFIRFT